MEGLRSGLFRKFFTVLAVLSLAPVALLGIQLTRISRQGIQDSVLELHTKLAEKTAEQIDDYFRVSNEKVAYALAALQKPMEWRDKQELLRSLIETHADIVEISMLGSKGQELLKVYNPGRGGGDELLSRAHEEGFQRALAEKSRTLSISREEKEPTALLYYPIPPTLVARVRLSLARLESRVAAERVGGTGFAVVVGREGRPFLYDERRLTLEQARDLPRWPITASALQSSAVGSSEFRVGSRAWVGAYAPVPSLGKAVLILQDRGEAYSAATEMRLTAAFVVVAAGLLCFVGALSFARRLTRPIFSLARAAEAVSKGDFLAKVDISTGDELEALAETFNRMTAQLRAYSVLQVDRLIAEQRKTEAILYSIDDGIIMIDNDRKVRLANRRALEILGANPALALDGKDVAEAVFDDRMRQAVLAVCSELKDNAFKDVDLSDEKTRRTVRVAAHPVVSPGKAARLGAVVALRDVTLERELDRMKEEFLHYITHDLRSPLGSAMGFLDVLLKGTAGVLTPEQHGIVSSIKRSTSRLMGLVNNILDIAKMESGRIRLQLKEVSVAGVAGRSIAILESLAKAKKIEVALEALEEHTVSCDADLLERVFTNLLGNAIKYTPEGGRIVVSVSDEGEAIKCCVADTGDGIPAEYRERIFEKFEQVQGQRRGGTGLGLTISRFFVEAHRGSIWVESELGRGSRFYFTVPKSLALDAEGAVVAGAQAA